MSKSTCTPTAAPSITDAEIKTIRAAAHRYLLAGGSVWSLPTRTCDEADRDEHFGNIADRRDPAALPAFEQALDTVTDHAQHETLDTAAWSLANSYAESAYLFGVAMGLELAGLVISTPLSTTDTRRGTKGGRP
jgi:hypothetical protein